MITPTQSYTLYSSPSDVQVNSPTIWYDSPTQRWIVTGSGVWKNRNWDYTELRAAIQLPPKFVGATRNVGGYDLYGIVFTNISGSYSGVSLVSCYCQITDGQGGYQITSTSRNTGDAADGVGFLNAGQGSYH